MKMTMPMKARIMGTRFGWMAMIVSVVQEGIGLEEWRPLQNDSEVQVFLCPRRHEASISNSSNASTRRRVLAKSENSFA
jgi:hypothetical protein